MQFSLKRKMVFSVVLAIAVTSAILLFMGLFVVVECTGHLNER